MQRYLARDENTQRGSAVSQRLRDGRDGIDQMLGVVDQHGSIELAHGRDQRGDCVSTAGQAQLECIGDGAGQ